MLLGHEESYTIVQSGLKGLMQHDPYSWEIRDGDFIRLKEITEGSCLVDRTIKTWISELSPRNGGRLLIRSSIFSGLPGPPGPASFFCRIMLWR